MTTSSPPRPRVTLAPERSGARVTRGRMGSIAGRTGSIAERMGSIAERTGSIAERMGSIRGRTESVQRRTGNTRVQARVVRNCTEVDR